MYWFSHFWHSSTFSPGIAFLIWLPFCLIVIVITPPFLPKFFSIGKNGHKGIPDSDKHSDIVSNHRFVLGFHYFVAEQSHMDDRDDDPTPCLKVANGLFAESLGKSFLDLAEFFFKEIYFHKFTSFLHFYLPFVGNLHYS
jgi:hypothetical protein